MTRISVMLPFMPPRPQAQMPFAELVRSTVAERLWQGQAMLQDPFHGFVHCGAAGVGVPTGVGVALMPLRHPYQAALEARSVAMSTGQPVVAGFGPGARSFQETTMGQAYPSQLTAVREYVTIVRDLLAGRRVHVRGEYFTCLTGLPAVRAPRVEVGLGVLRPGMARLAGELADVAITWLTPARYISEVLVPALAEGAARAGRDAPPRIAAMVPVALEKPGRDPVRVVMSSNRLHFTAPHYQDMLARAGITVSPRDPRGTTEEVVRGGAFVMGDADEIRRRVEEYVAAGVDEVILNTTGVCALDGVQGALAELRTLVDVLQPLTEQEEVLVG